MVELSEIIKSSIGQIRLVKAFSSEIQLNDLSILGEF